jgi:proline iminopeptidase
MKTTNHKFIVMATAIISAITIGGCEKEIYLDEPGNLVPKTADQDPAIPSVIINGARLHSEAFGPPDSTLIVVLHGGPGSDYRYLLKCKEFANQGYRVVFYDQRGCGLSQRFSKSSYSLKVMFDELGGVIDHYRTSPSQKVFLLGQSWGAMLATAYVNEHPSAISGLILAEPGGFVWHDIADYSERSREAGIAGEMLNDVTYMDQFITGKESQQEILDYKFGLLSFAETDKDNPMGNEAHVPFWRWGAVCNHSLFELGEAEQPDWTTNLYQFPTKILFMYSENNRAYGEEWAKKVSSAYPNVQLFEVMGAGHDMLTFDTGWNNAYPVMLEYLNSMNNEQ